MKTVNISKEINFIPDFVIAERNKINRLIVVAFSTTFITLLAFSVYFFPEMKIFTLNIQVDNAKMELRSMEDVRAIKSKLDQAQSKLNQKKKILDDINKSEVDAIGLMDKLNSAAPENVVLTYLSVNGKDDIKVTYSINNPIEATELTNNLRALNLFQDVSTPVVPIEDQKSDVNFALKLKN